MNSTAARALLLALVFSLNEAMSGRSRICRLKGVRGTGPTALLGGLFILSAALDVEALGDQSFYDYARVTQVMPIQETVRVPVESEQCDRYTPPQNGEELAALAGDVRSAHPHLSLTDVLRADLNRWQRTRSAYMPQCRLVKVFENEIRTVAYRVHYRYGDDTFIKRMDYDPGEWLRVRVRLQASD